MIAIVVLTSAVLILIALVANIRQIPWDFGTVTTFSALILCLIIGRRWRTLGGLCLLYFIAGALAILGHLPPKNDPYAPVPAAQPTNTLVIPKKD